VNGPLKEYDSKIRNLFVRPTFSKLFVNICKNRFEDLKYCLDRSFGFRGYINCNTRYNMFNNLIQKNNGTVKVDLISNNHWNGPSLVGSKIQEEYLEDLKKYAFSLCPRGSGTDSVRLLESCYYGRVPVLISDVDYLLVDHKYSDSSFIRRIIWDGKTDLAPILKELTNIEDCIIKEDQTKARYYFDNTLRKYMDNPTKYMLNWMEKQGLVNE